ncbi:MAG TPA: hypothetical protein VFZ65_05640 [Planctomycetota bacterium]|nr:hypothetical protein [Planctomycetota bacterium]
MRPFPIVLLCSLSAGPLVAQDASATVAGDAVRITHHSGLQRDDTGQGLCGVGEAYGAHFSTAGMRFEPALGVAVHDTQYLALRPLSVRRGALMVVELPAQVPPEHVDRTAVYARSPRVTERYDVRPDRVELSWVFEQPPAGQGDLVVRYAVDTSLPAPVAKNGGLAFELPGIGGVQVGGVTGVDARGTRVAGALHCVDGVLELSLPAAFVATAAYPIVLDPAIGALLYLSSTLNPQDEPDVAYDRTTGCYLVAWRRTYSASQSQIIGQLVGSNGALFGPEIVMLGAGLQSRPRVANLGTRNRFGVVWTQTFNSVHSVEFKTVEIATGQISHGLTVASSTTGDFDHADVGCESDASVGAARAFVVAYEDNVNGAIRVRRIWFNLSDSLLSSAAVSVYTNGGLLGSSYSQPQISRRAAADGRLLLVARRSSLSLASSIVCAVVPTDGSALGPFGTVYSNSAFSVTVPDVDGVAGRWVVAWQRSVSAGTPQPLGVAPVSLDGAGTLSAGADHTVAGGLTGASAPSVGYTPGRSWIGYRAVNNPTGNASLAVESIDSGTCISGLEVFAFPVATSESRIVVTTLASSGDTTGETGLAAWSIGGGVYGQLVRNYNNAGAITNLGGGCGGGGTQSFSHAPAIGSSGFVCAVSGLLPTALLTIFNFSPPGAAIPCGTCVWTPFSVTLTPPIAAGYASVAFPIPDLLSLVGAQFETQWTTFDPTQVPCSLLPGFALSPRTRLTIGN